MKGKRTEKQTKETKSLSEFKKAQSFVRKQSLQRAKQLEAQKRRRERLNAVGSIVSKTTRAGSADKGPRKAKQQQKGAQGLNESRTRGAVAKLDAKAYAMTAAEERHLLSRGVLRVRNSPFRTETALITYFRQFGKVKNASLERSPVTGEATGRALVEFEWRHEADEAAREADGEIVAHRRLSVRTFRASHQDEQLFQGPSVEPLSDLLERRHTNYPAIAPDAYEMYVKEFHHEHVGRLGRLQQSYPESDYQFPPVMKLELRPEFQRRKDARLAKHQSKIAVQKKWTETEIGRDFGQDKVGEILQLLED